MVRADFAVAAAEQPSQHLGRPRVRRDRIGDDVGRPHAVPREQRVQPRQRVDVLERLVARARRRPTGCRLRCRCRRAGLRFIDPGPSRPASRASCRSSRRSDGRTSTRVDLHDELHRRLHLEIPGPPQHAPEAAVHGERADLVGVGLPRLAVDPAQQRAERRLVVRIGEEVDEQRDAAARLVQVAVDRVADVAVVAAQRGDASSARAAPTTYFQLRYAASRRTASSNFGASSSHSAVKLSSNR